ncbi:MAG: Ig-like domain-containing protein [Acidimicrobiia bacterium]|nr:Ig-like domain-containing protein [Acidimicrobiia bacterium]
MTIEKTTSTPIVLAGGNASYAYLLENTGSDPLTSVTVIDDRCPSPAFDSEVSGNADAVFDPGEQWRYICDVTVTGDVTNTAYASAVDELAQTVTSPTDSVTVDVIAPAVELRKSADAGQVTPGTTITYTIEVENLGDDPLVNVVVTDDTCAGLSLPAGDGGAAGVLDVGETWTYTCTLTAGTSDVVNVANVSAEDSLGQPVADSDTVTVIVNLPPTAVDDVATPNENTPTDIDVLANDSDSDGVLDPASATILTGPTDGVVSIDPNTGVITYTPNAGFVGVDSFTYEVCDDDGACDSATVTVDVNAAPLTTPDMGITNEATPINLDVAFNDSDPEGASLTVTGFPTPPLNGIVVIEPDGTVTYTPNAGFTGTETFTYEVCDPSGACSIETVTIDINTPPTAVDDPVGTLADTPVVIDVLANDLDADANIDPTSVTIVSGANNGSLSVDPVTGEITYTPIAGFVGVDTFVYEVCDDLGLCDTGVVTVDVTDVNTPPTAVDDFEITDRDVPVTVDVLANDLDAESNIDPTSVSITSDPTNGSATVDPVTGEITYTPGSLFTGSDQLTYEVCDLDGACDTALLDLLVNVPPIVADDTASTNQGDPVVVDVLANDSDADGVIDPSTVLITSAPSDGTVSIDPTTGEITYTPDPGFFGTDTFTYWVCDNSGSCAEGTVTVTVNGAPVTGPDSAVTNDSTVVSIDVLANDTDPESDPLTVTDISTGPLFGTATINGGTGEIEYTPYAGFNGVDTFTYEVCDDQLACSIETVTVTVDGPPTAVDDSAVTAPLIPVIIDVLANDMDPEGLLDPASVTVTSGPSNGSTSINTSTGEITYTPNAGVVSDTFTYEVCDSAGPPQCDSATVTVAVDDPVVNDPPVAVDDSAATQLDTAVTSTVLANDIDPENGTLTVTQITASTAGANVDINGGTTVTYTPPPGFTGVDTYTYEVCDDGSPALCDTAVVTVFVNAPPVLVADSAATTEDSPVSIPVLGNDFDPDGFLLPGTVAVVAGPSSGTVDVDPVTGVITYTPDPGTFGPDTFTYEACDNDGGCSTATVTVDVNALPDAVEDTASAESGVPVTIDVLLNDSDPDGTIDPTGVSIVGGPTNGTVTVDPVTGEVTYTSNSGFAGTDSFTYEVCDNLGACSTASVVVAVNGRPVVVDDTATTNQAIPVTIAVLANDSDPDGLDLTSLVVIAGPGNGFVNINPDGTIRYTPDPDFLGTDAFSYRICDSLGACDTGTVVVGINGAPTAIPDPIVVNEGQVVNFDPRINDTDPEGDPLTIAGFPTPPTNGSVIIEADGTVTYTPAPGFIGFDSFTYEVCDDSGACAVATITVRVNGLPTAVNDAAVTGMSTPVAIPVLANDVDPEGALVPSTVTVTSGPAHGTTTVDPATGVVTYLPENGFTGTDTFIYRVCDDAGACSSATVTVSIGNPPPIGAPDFALTDEDTPVTIPVLANDGDPTGETLFIGGATQPANGAVVINASGTITYTPDPDFSGTDTFTYQVCDFSPAATGPQGTSCVVVTVTITVVAVNDAPVLVSPTVITVVPGDAIPPLLATDAEGDSLTFVLAAGTLPPGVTLNADGTFSGIPTVLGVYVFTVQVCDSGSPQACTTVVLSLVIQPLATTGLGIELWLLLALLLFGAGTLVLRLTGGNPADGEPAA